MLFETNLQLLMSIAHYPLGIGFAPLVRLCSELEILEKPCVDF